MERLMSYDALIKVIIFIKNIINLPGQHKIKGKLCNSEGLEKIYNLLGDSRLRRWLSYLIEEQLTIE